MMCALLAVFGAKGGWGRGSGKVGVEQMDVACRRHMPESISGVTFNNSPPHFEPEPPTGSGLR